ncbi:MAG TPA: hypothetical protein VK743_22535 [Steroidobacteraceae bacterium]|jgi:hypothetical protein|nr:hypothetical protein [Steroidobacteraceae bacterium]
MNKLNTEQKLEQVLHQALSGLPPRRAPASLESRVAEQLARRASQPWWRASFANWPVAARVTFILVCAVLGAGTILGGVSAYLGNHSFDEASALLLSWAQPFLTVVSSAGGLVALLLHVIPPLWLYGIFGVGVFLYVTLFGLGAAAYRTLYLPSSAGDAS